MQSFLVIGLGNFGIHIAKSMKEYGSRVTGLDTDEGHLASAKAHLDATVRGDARDRAVLGLLGLKEFSGVVVAVEDPATSILIAITLRDLGVDHIIARASSDDHCRVLEEMKVFDIVYPDRDAAARAGKTLSLRNVLDFIPLAGDYVVMNIHPPKSFIGMTIRDLQIGQRFQCQILGIKFGQGDKNWRPDTPEWENMKIAPTADDTIPENSVLLFLGRKGDLKRIQELD